MNFKISFPVKMGFIALLTLSSFHSLATESSGTKNFTSYPSSFFMQYHPQNAYDMIDRLPGFSFDGGSDERGFGGNAGNVLIDGTRPTSKSGGGLKGALSRIPVAQVEKIEIIRGGKGSSETSGQSIIANIIRKKDITTGTWALKLRRAPDRDLRPNIEAAITTKIGDWNTAFDTDIGGWVGYRTAIIENENSNDVLTKSANEILDDRNNWANVSGQGSKEFTSGQLTLNGRVAGNKWQGDTTRDISHANQTSQQLDEFWQLNEENAQQELEFGVDWLGNAPDWKWHVLGLAVVNNRNYENSFANENFITLDKIDNTFKQDRLKTEYIFRNTYGKVGDEKFRPEYGFEIANNKLDTELFSVQNNQTQVLNTADVVVEELRGEAFVTFTYAATNKLTIEGGLTAEFSSIEVTGDAENKQNFKFLKPRLSATYHVSPTLQLNILADHSVGQLNFNDFADSNQAADNRSTAGNPNLKPDQTTALSGELNWAFNEKGSLSVNIFYNWHKDILENIVIQSANGDVSQALGNAGDASLWGFEAELNLPLDAVIQNGLLNISYEYERSEYFDSIINSNRTMNDNTPKEFNIEFRQDLVEYKIAWGGEFISHFTNSGYLVDEVRTFEGNNRIKAFVETTYFDGFKVQLHVEHLNTGEYNRSRFLYENDRSGVYKGSQIERRERAPELKLSVWGTF